MNKALHTWLSKYVRFDTYKYESNLSGLVVDMFVSDQCNLQCKHCYFGNTHTLGTPLSTQDWINIVDSLYSEGVRHFHISGRESSLDNRIIDIVSFIKSRDATYTGLVSNGTGDISFYRRLISEGVDYLEFSLDGIAETHNYMRGKDIFTQVTELLGSLSEYSDFIDVSTCLNQKSFEEYIGLVDYCLRIGIHKFFATPFLPVGNGKSLDTFAISPLMYSQLLEQSFDYLAMKPDQKIILKYCIPHEMTYSLIRDGEYVRNIIISYLLGESDLVFRVKGNLMQLSLDLLDVKFAHNITITNDGEVIPCSDYISENNYVRYSIGNVLRDNVPDIIQARADAINENIKKLLL